MGGSRAPVGRQPWMVALTDRRVSSWRRSFFCGGVLVRVNWVLTARHCIWGMTRGRVAAFPGGGSLWRDPRKGLRVRAIRRAKSPDLDLALLRLQPGSGRKPLRPSDLVPGSGSIVTAFGWGSTGRGPRIVGRLRRVDLMVRSLERCRSTYFGAFNPFTMLCAGGDGFDTCLGDSGGPLVRRGQLVGTTSFGQGCGREPGVYARVDTVADWLARVVRQERLRAERSR